ncbi:hypothetical protein U1Q18_022270, partial [Sarracenia purpurea var. burkii]
MAFLMRSIMVFVLTKLWWRSDFEHLRALLRDYFGAVLQWYMLHFLSAAGSEFGMG